jgi:sugar transferase (PEP-CTERM system associated)
MKIARILPKSLDLSLNKEEKVRKVSDPMIIGDFDQISSICQTTRVDRIVVALDERRGKLPIEQLLACRLKGIRVDEGADFTEELCGRLSVECLYPSSLIFSDGFRRSFITEKLKRWMDIFLSLAVLILCSIAGLVVGIAIKLESQGPVFYRQKRVGENGGTFDLLKFRSMRADAEENGPRWASNGDERITRVGRVIRKLRIDEIPQVINVLKGEMSFVGPRPERPFFVDQLQKEIPFYSYRHTVKPGITGWAQIYYRYGASKEDALEKLKYDLYYVKYMSLILDLIIVIETMKVVLLGTGAR